MEEPSSGHSSSDTSPITSPRTGPVHNVAGLGDESPDPVRGLRAAPSLSSLGSLGELSSPGRSYSLSDMDLSPGEEPRKGRQRGAHLAAFGAKLTSGTVLGQNFKSKMFRQSRGDLKALRKKTDLSLPINDRSPMARTSRELDRIAALGSPGQSFVPSEVPPRKHHHMPFRKKDSPSTVLSSSSSNSRLASEGSVYSFQGGPLHAYMGDRPSFKSNEECMAFLASTWSLLCSRTQPVFSEQKLRIPVEDANTLVTLHFGAHVQSGASALEMMERLNELLVTGMRPHANFNGVPQHKLLGHLAETWERFFTKTLLLLEAIFLPLQLEIDGHGTILKTPELAEEYWKPLRANGVPLSVRRSILVAFRDMIILPIADRLRAGLMDGINFDAPGAQISHRAARITQCLNTMALVQTKDVSQDKVEDLVQILRESWVSRPRIGKDRRGLVLKRPESVAN